MLILRDVDIVPTHSGALIPRVAVPADVSLSMMRHNSKLYASRADNEKRNAHCSVDTNRFRGTGFLILFDLFV